MESLFNKFKNNKDMQAQYLKWMSDPMTRLVFDIMKEIVFRDSMQPLVRGDGALPGSQGVLTELCALNDRRRSGWAECLAMAQQLDELSKPMQQMPDADYPDLHVEKGK
jgi:hypothetical protein